MSDEPLEATLARRFGFTQFLPGQRAVVEHLLAGRSSAAVFPTGAGKSLCYQLPATRLLGVTLVVSPLIALMKDQIDALRAKGIAASRLDSTLDATAYREVVDSLRQGTLDLLYVAPERFNNERFRQSMAQIRVALFAVDEAHCISEWGHNFRPDYLKLPGFARELGAERVLALTATATEAVLEDIRVAFEIDRAAVVRTGFHRPNLELRTTATTEEGRDELLRERIEERPRGATIIYVTQQKTAERVAAQLQTAGHAARAYHAGLESEARDQIQEWFMTADDGIVVATIAFGMGIDKANIRAVYHYNLPKSLENYAQEIGRAGRDGEASVCEMLVCLEDCNVLENFVYGDTPTREAIGGLLDDLVSQPERFAVNEHSLSNAHDIRSLVVRTLLTYLELDGAIEGGTPFYSRYRFKEVEPIASILAKFEGERRTFLEGLFERATRARTWWSIDLDATALELQVPRDRIVRALDWCAEQRLLEVEATGVQRSYRWIRRPADPSALADALFERVLARERAELGRLHEVLAFASHDGCQTSLLCARFSDPLPSPCGHCSWCLDAGQRLELPPRRHFALHDGSVATAETQIWQRLQQLRRDHAVLAQPRVLARFACGVPSPSLTRGRLTRHPLFGALAHVPFADILLAADAPESAAPSFPQ